MARVGDAQFPSHGSTELAARARWLRRLALELTRDQDLADDLVQDTLVAWLRRPRDAQEAGPGWLRTVLKNLLIDRARAQRVRDRGVPPSGERDDDQDASLEQELDMGRVIDRLDREVHALREPFRTTLRLSYFSDLTSAEVASRLGVPAATVRRRNQIAIEQLRKRLEEHFRPDAGIGHVRALLARLALVPTGWRRTRPTPLRLRPIFAVPAAVATLVVAPMVVRHASLGARAGERRAPAGVVAAAGDRHDVGPHHARRGAPMETAATASAVPTFVPAESDAAPSVPPVVGSCPSLQALVDDAAPGATVSVPPCVYREKPVIDKPLTLEGQPGAEIRGSDVWSAFTARADGTWESVARVPPFGARDAGDCAARPDAPCRGLSAVYRDGELLARVGERARPGPNQFAVSAARTIVLGADPEGHLIEVFTRQAWVSIRASEVTITGFRMRHAVSHDDVGAIDLDRPAEHVTLRRNVLSHTVGPVVSAAGRNHEIVDNEIFGAGRAGVVLRVPDRIRVSGNDIHHNGAWFRGRTGWQDGGVNAYAGNAVVVANDLHHNVGAGFFCFACREVAAVANVVRDNGGAAVRYMLTSGGQIESNQLFHNGWGAIPREPAIILKETSAITVRSNIVTEHPGGVRLVRRDGRDPPTPSLACPFPSGNAISDNVLIDVGEAMALAFDRRTLLATPGCQSNQILHNRLWSDRTTLALEGGAPDVEPLSAAERDRVMGLARLALTGRR